MTILWLSLGGLVALLVVLIIAAAFGIRIDGLGVRLCRLAGAFLSLAIVFIGILPIVTDRDFLVFCTVISSIVTGLAWFFLISALIHFVSAAAGQRVTPPDG